MYKVEVVQRGQAVLEAVVEEQRVQAVVVQRVQAVVEVQQRTGSGGGAPGAGSGGCAAGAGSGGGAAGAGSGGGAADASSGGGAEGFFFFILPLSGRGPAQSAEREWPREGSEAEGRSEGASRRANEGKAGKGLHEVCLPSAIGRS